MESADIGEMDCDTRFEVQEILSNEIDDPEFLESAIENLSEILNLKWEQVDLNHGFILLDITKNGKRREISVDNTLEEMFNRMPRGFESKYVFAGKDGDPYKSVKRSFSTALKKAGISFNKRITLFPISCNNPIVPKITGLCILHNLANSNEMIDTVLEWNIVYFWNYWSYNIIFIYHNQEENERLSRLNFVTNNTYVCEHLINAEIKKK